MRKIVTLSLLLFSFINIKAYCQNAEIAELKNNKAITYNIDSIQNNQGLIATIKYPTTFSPTDEKSFDAVLIKQFFHPKEFLIYQIFNKTRPDSIHILELLESHLKENILLNTPDANFIGYQSGFKINNKNAAYIEYSLTVSGKFFCYSRQYFIITGNHLVIIDFVMGKKNNETKEALLARFKRFYIFFQEYSNTFKVIDN